MVIPLFPRRDERRHCPSSAAGQGFTLIELLVVLAIVATLLTLAVPRYFKSVENSKDAVLMENLRTTRETIDKYYGDTGRYPDKLEDLVEKKYLRALPYDPITSSTETWLIVPPENAEKEDGPKGKVYDIKSGAPGNSHDGTPYTEF